MSGRNSVSGYVGRRSLHAVPVLAVIALVTFLLSRLVPGDPAVAQLGEGATQAQIDQLNAQWGLDQSVPTQLWHWAVNLVQGDLGNSIWFNAPVGEVLVGHIGPTLSIAILSVVISVAVGVPVGLLAGHKPGSLLDRGLMAVAFVGVSLPEFWIAMLLVLAFGVHLDLLPVSGYVEPSTSLSGWMGSIMLPAVALAVDQVALLSRMVRDAVIRTNAEPWVTSLRARGLSARTIVGKHQLKSASIAAITVIGNSLGGLITAAVAVEIVFNIQGFGWLAVQAALQRDYPLMQGTVLVAAAAYVVVNLVVDAMYAVLDPRIRVREA